MISKLGWWSIENRHYDACVIMSDNIVYDLVAILVPSYFERPEIHSSYTPLSLHTDSPSCTLLQIFIFPHDCGSLEPITS